VAETGKRVAELLREAASLGSVIIVCHRNADPDALASSLLALKGLQALRARACIALPEGLSRASKNLVGELGVELPACGEASDAGAILVVDSSNSTQLGDLREFLGKAPLYLIDHHSPGDLAGIARKAVIEPWASSTTQLLVAGLDALEIKLEPLEATIGLAGIIYDTRRFSIADPCAFRASARLIEWGGDYQLAVRILQARREPGEGMEYAERIARIKAAQRMIVSRICNDIIIAVTRVSAFEASAARALLDLGADVAVVVGGKGGELRATLRLSRRALDAGLRADELASYIASKLGGKGGGHAAAGMAHIPEPPQGVEKVVEAIAKSLPGKAARICLERRGSGSGREEGQSLRGR
jgi:nanoRNase/pAp phosphatase (c-di-AMP/oligoRNAs hydrolase)